MSGPLSSPGLLHTGPHSRKDFKGAGAAEDMTEFGRY